MVRATVRINTLRNVAQPKPQHFIVASAAMLAFRAGIAEGRAVMSATRDSVT